MLCTEHLLYAKKKLASGACNSDHKSSSMGLNVLDVYYILTTMQDYYEHMTENVESPSLKLNTPPIKAEDSSLPLRFLLEAIVKLTLLEKTQQKMMIP